MSDDHLKGRAQALLDLHQPGNPVILPTVWDAWSARLAVDAGFAALTVGSHPVADSVGKPDNEGMTFDDVLDRVGQITAAVDVPISVDIESGYAQTPARLIEGLLSVGAVGLNIEDTVHSEGGRLRSADEHAELVWGLRAAADASGVHVVVNARTDLFLRQDGDEADRVDRAIARLRQAADSGADVLYPVGRHQPETLQRLTSELPLPVNAIGVPDQDDPASFGPLGVARVSFGPFLQGALAARGKEILARWA
ncbi:isocitrate lyase/phosphoenolpyruvate mutase family protein [Mycolicibacterium hippocampi]|uniref:isocitrate lyase/PEP mutase family protein n=1 Tax=Mycolicibacterium hippocampi TaxID=659824 RepID=UPI003514667D